MYYIGFFLFSCAILFFLLYHISEEDISKKVDQPTKLGCLLFVIPIALIGIGCLDTSIFSLMLIIAISIFVIALFLSVKGNRFLVNRATCSEEIETKPVDEDSEEKSDVSTEVVSDDKGDKQQETKLPPSTESNVKEEHIKTPDELLIEQAESEKEYQTILTEDQFYELKNAIDAGLRFINMIGGKKDFLNFYMAKTGVRNDIPFYLKNIFAADILRNYREFGYSTEMDLGTLTGQSLYHVVRCLLLENEPDYNHFGFEYAMEDGGYVGLKVRTPVREALKHFKATEFDVYYPGAPDDFYLCILLACYDDLYEKKYREILKNIAVVISNLDDKNFIEKARWLGEIDSCRAFWDHLYSTIGRASGVDAPEEDEELLTETSSQESLGTKKQSYFNQLNELVGLAETKREIMTLSNYVQMKQKRDKMGMKSPNISYHCVFAGNPGTGKTTVARILAGIYKDLGILKSGHLVETDRSGLVAEYVGQTAIKTNQIIDKAMDGVLFIDEAYSLVQGGKDDYGKEAIATLLKRMEDDRDRLVVILAGYTKEIEDFINSNPGLRSRFNRYIHFPDYSAQELFNIFCIQAKKNEYTLSDGAIRILKKRLKEVLSSKGKDFGNARYVRNLFEKVVERQADRLANKPNLTKVQLAELREEDFMI